MVRSVAGKVMWMARATTTVVGLAIMLALLLGIASMALGADGKPFILGKKNTASKVSKLVKSGVGPALSLKVGSGPPLQVNSSDTVANLNSDLLDGKEASEFASAYERTVVVSPTGTDTQNGTALRNALSGITDASAAKPYLLFIEAGMYNLGSASLAMKQHVDIQGAGELKTLITSSVGTSTADNCIGTVRGSNNAELRFLTVSNTGTLDCQAVISNIGASPRLTQVTAESTGGGAGDHYGVYNESSNPTMTNVTTTSSGDGFNVGVVNSGSSPTIRHSRLSGTDFSLRHDGGTAKVALTQLVGGVSKPSGTLQCFDNYNDSLGAASCP